MHVANRLAEACAVAEVSMSAVARAWGVDESVVRELRDGVGPVWAERIDLLPPRVRRAYHEAALRDIDEAAPSSALTLDDHVYRDGELHGLVCAEVREAKRDGVVDIEELRRIRRARLVALAHDQQAIVDLDREIARHVKESGR